MEVEEEEEMLLEVEELELSYHDHTVVNSDSGVEIAIVA